MKFRGQKANSTDNQSVAHAAVNGTPRQEWPQCAVRKLSQLQGVDRAGVWLTAGDALAGSESLEGVLWDREAAEPSREWRKVSITALPEELVLRLQALEIASGVQRHSAVPGLLAGLHRVLWQPIASNGQFYGALLLGARNAGAILPVVEAQEVAAELALASERDGEKQRQHAVSTELGLTRSVLQQLETGGRVERVLQKLAAATAPEIPFCAIAHWDTSQKQPRPVFRWKGGDEAWLSSLSGALVSELCATSWRTGQMAAAQPVNLSNAPALSRMVAVPLRNACESLGVLVAGLSRSSASLASMEHIELRAQLAALALARFSGKQEPENAPYRDISTDRAFQTKLLQTEKLAALGQMMTGVVHELSSPLTTILGYAQRLLRSSSPGQVEDARQILQEAERASRILRETLSNARESTFERRKLDLNDLVRRSIDLQRFALAADKINVELDLDPMLPRLQGDAGRLQQVIINLLGNARQAIEQEDRGGTVRIQTSRSEGRIVLEVQDDGPGIPEPIRARIFDPFFTTKPAGVGTGLGLTIVLGIIREHGGNVHVGNVPNGGARFRIELPAASQATELSTPRRSLPAASRDRGKDALPKKETPPSLHRESALFRKRILIVEDEPVVARLIADVLQDEGMNVEVLLDGHTALERIARESFDLIICDMKMPGLDGQHFYKSLLRMGNPVDGKILFVTGDVIGQKTRSFLEQYQLPRLAKPFRVEELTSKVFEFFESKPETRVAARQGKP